MIFETIAVLRGPYMTRLMLDLTICHWGKILQFFVLIFPRVRGKFVDVVDVVASSCHRVVIHVVAGLDIFTAI